MSKVFSIPNYKELTKNKKITEYIKPQIIYIPLESKLGVKYKHHVKEGDYVYKGSVVATNTEINFPIHSSVSGYVIKGTMKVMNNGSKIKCIVVENDFKEKYESKSGAKKNIDKYSQTEFVRMLRDSGITGLGGSDFPTYIKYSSSNSQYLIVNAVECEPMITSDYSIMGEHSEEILDCIDAILEIMSLKKAFIAINETNIKMFKEFNKYIGSYPNIKLISVFDAYPNGWERNLIEGITNLTYKKYPTECGVIINNVSTIYAIYEMLKYNRPLTERVITITGSGIKKPQNVKVKIGASISEIINHIEGYKDINDLLFIAGGPMMGKSLPTDDIVVTKDLNAVIVMKNELKEASPCIKCGKCAKVCPVGIIPIMAKENINNTEILKQLNVNKCIECGLCSYICPSKIAIREFVKVAKKEVK